MIFFTNTIISGSLTINRADGVSEISITPQTASSCTVVGTMTFQGIDSAPITVSGETFVVSASSPQSTIDGLTITWVSGGIDVLMGF